MFVFCLILGAILYLLIEQTLVFWCVVVPAVVVLGIVIMAWLKR